MLYSSMIVLMHLAQGHQQTYGIAFSHPLRVFSAIVFQLYRFLRRS